MANGAELFRFVAVRAPQRRPADEGIIIYSHPAKDEPTDFLQGLRELADAGSYQGMVDHARAFVAGPDFVSSGADLEVDLAPVLDPDRDPDGDPDASPEGGPPRLAPKALQQIARRIFVDVDQDGDQDGDGEPPIDRDRRRLGDSVLAQTLAGGRAGDPQAPRRVAPETSRRAARHIALLSSLLRANRLLARLPTGRRSRLPQLTADEIESWMQAPIRLPDWVFEVPRCRFQQDYYWREEGAAGDSPAEPPPQPETDPATDPVAASSEEPECTEPDPCCARITPFVADLMTVRQELQRYEPRELAYVENVLRGEKRIRTHRHLRERETETVVETSRSRLEERDHQVAEKFSLSRETSSTLSADAEFETGVTATAKYGKNLTIQAHRGLTLSTSLERSQEVATEYARDVTQRAQTRLEEKHLERRTVRTLEQIEETNRHVLSNADGEDHAVGIYHWVDEVSKAQVLNYGRRLMIDLAVAEPARFYRFRRDQGEHSALEPLDPGPPPEIGPGTISDDPQDDHFYLTLAQRFGLTGLTPPPERRRLVTSGALYYDGANDQHLTTLSAGEGLRLHTFDDPLTVPEGYRAAELRATGPIDWDSGGPHSVNVVVGSGIVNAQQGKGFGTATLRGEEGTLKVLVQSWGVTTFSLSVLVECERTEGAFQAWQLDVHQSILEAYERRRADFERARAARVEGRDRRLRVRPSRFREIERQELKRQLLSLVTCQSFDSYDAMKPCVLPCEFPQVSATEIDAEGRSIQFFEQAFEWPHMTYVFYPYFWSNKCEWPERLQESSDDPQFERFLHAGAARVQVPVRPGFEKLVLYYLETGQIWGGEEDPPQPGSDVYLAIVDEIREQQRAGLTFREGTLVVETGQAEIEIHPGADLTQDDVDREILIDCQVYRLVELEVGTSGQPGKGVLDRPFEGPSSDRQKFAVGALHVGVPWEVRVPTELVYLRNDSTCLPEYPLPPCEEGE